MSSDDSSEEIKNTKPSKLNRASTVSLSGYLADEESSAGGLNKSGSFMSTSQATIDLDNDSSFGGSFSTPPARGKKRKLAHEPTVVINSEDLSTLSSNLAKLSPETLQSLIVSCVVNVPGAVTHVLKAVSVELGQAAPEVGTPQILSAPSITPGGSTPVAKPQ